MVFQRCGHMVQLGVDIADVKFWHYQFDSLRRAKHSSTQLLYHLHNPRAFSASVRCAHSIAKGLPEAANHVSSLRSIVAPRLSELETNMYLKPFSSSASSVPEPTIAGYRSPWPGGHHSQSGLAGHEAGAAAGKRGVSAGAVASERQLLPPHGAVATLLKWQLVGATQYRCILLMEIDVDLFHQGIVRSRVPIPPVDHPT